ELGDQYVYPSPLLVESRDIPSVSAPPPPAPHNPIPNYLAPHHTTARPGQMNRTGLGFSQDRSRSVPTIPSDVIAHVKQYALKKRDNILTTAPKGPVKSWTIDSDVPPPLPPNHPTAGKSELEMVMKAINRNSSDSSGQEKDDEIQNMPQSESAAANNITQSVNAEQVDTRANARQRNPDVQSTQAVPGPNDRRASEPLTEQPGTANELAEVTAKVTKRSALIKKGPEVAPKPTAGGVVSKTLAAIEGDSQGNGGTDQPSPGQIQTLSSSSRGIDSYRSSASKKPVIIPADIISEENESEGIVYAQLRQELMPCSLEKTSDDTYQNAEVLRNRNLTSNVSCEDWSGDKMNYAEVSSGFCQSGQESSTDSGIALYHVPWDYKVKKDEEYEPVESMFGLVGEDAVFYLNNTDLAAQLQDLEQDQMPAETYEPIEQRFNHNSMLCIKTSSLDRKFSGASPLFFSLSANGNTTSEHYLNENATKRRGFVKAKDSKTSTQRRKGVCHGESENSCLENMDRKSVGRRHSIQTEYECRKQAVSGIRFEDADEPGENQVYQSIQFRMSKSLTKSSSALFQGFSRSDEIYEGIEWTPQKQSSQSLPRSHNGPFNQINKVTAMKKTDQAKRMNHLKKAGTIGGCGRALSDICYAQVSLPSPVQDMENGHSHYIDVVANYEDIKAAKAARGSFSGPSLEPTSSSELPMRRSKSEISRPIIAPVASENIKKKLGNLMLGSAKTLPRMGKDSSLESRLHSSVPDVPNDSPSMYENIGAYQNTMGILAVSKN
ncbi:hypothetical protein PoB_003180200, partial [Plakobranchus ocellatus]